MIVVTTDKLEGYEVVEYKGLVFGDYRQNGTFKNDIRIGRTAVLEEMEDRAQAMGANAILGVNVTYAPFGNDVIGEMIVYAIGTAVVVKRAK